MSADAINCADGRAKVSSTSVAVTQFVGVFKSRRGVLYVIADLARSCLCCVVADRVQPPVLSFCVIAHREVPILEHRVRV